MLNKDNYDRIEKKLKKLYIICIKITQNKNNNNILETELTVNLHSSYNFEDSNELFNINSKIPHKYQT